MGLNLTGFPSEGPPAKKTRNKTMQSSNKQYPR